MAFPLGELQDAINARGFGDGLYEGNVSLMIRQENPSIISKGKPVKEDEKDTWAEELLSKLDEIATSLGRPPVSQQVRESALGSSSDLVEVSGILTEEIATIRLLLRNTYRQALQTNDPHAYLRMVDLYSRGCVRLVRMLKIKGSDENGRLERYLQNSIDEAIRQVHSELRIAGER